MIVTLQLIPCVWCVIIEVNNGTAVSASLAPLFYQYDSVPDSSRQCFPITSLHCTTCLTEEAGGQIRGQGVESEWPGGRNTEKGGPGGRRQLSICVSVRVRVRANVHCTVRLAWLTTHCTPYRGEVDGYEQPRLKTRHGWATDIWHYIVHELSTVLYSCLLHALQLL